MEIIGFDQQNDARSLPALASPHHHVEGGIRELEEKLKDDRTATDVLGQLLHLLFLAPRAPGQLALTGGKDRPLLAHEQDIISRTLLRLVKYIDRWSPERGSFKSWSLGALYNERRRTPRKVHANSESWERLSRSADLQTFWTAPAEVEERLEWADTARAAEHILSQLSPRDAKLLQIASEAGKRERTKAIQEAFDVQPGTARQMYSRAVKRAQDAAARTRRTDELSPPPSTRKRSW